LIHYELRLTCWPGDRELFVGCDGPAPRPSGRSWTTSCSCGRRSIPTRTSSGIRSPASSPGTARNTW